MRGRGQNTVVRTTATWSPEAELHLIQREEILDLSFTCMQTLQQISRREKTTNQPYYHKKEKPLTVTGVECRGVGWIADGDPSALEKSPSSLGSLVGF